MYKDLIKNILLVLLVISTGVMTALYAVKMAEPAVEPEHIHDPYPVEVLPEKLSVNFMVDGLSTNQDSRAHVSFAADEYKDYDQMKIVEVTNNEQASFCIVQSWNTVTNSADTLEVGNTYALSTSEHAYGGVYASTRTNTEGSYARCNIRVELSRSSAL